MSGQEWLWSVVRGFLFGISEHMASCEGTAFEGTAFFRSFAGRRSGFMQCSLVVRQPRKLLYSRNHVVASLVEIVIMCGQYWL